MSTIVLGSDHSLFVISGADLSTASRWSGNTLVTVPEPTDPGAFDDVWVHTGDQWGPFEVTVEACPQAPDLDDRWEDVVEFSVATADGLVVCELIDRAPSAVLVEEPGTYRVRVSARDRGTREWDEDAPESDDPVEFFLIQAWPSPMAESAVVRLASDFARAELAGPQPTPVVPEREVGLEAAAAIGGDVRARRAMSGDTTTVVATARVAGTRRKNFLVLAHHINWSTGETSWMFMSAMNPGDDYPIGEPSYGFGHVHEDQLSGDGAIRTTFLEVERPARAVRTWNWMVPPADDAMASVDRWEPVLSSDATVTTTLVETKDDDGNAWTEVGIEYVGIPVEWSADFGSWLEYQLAIADL